MIVRLLGFMDLLGGILLFLLQFRIGTIFGFIIGFYLLAKGIAFITNVASVMDILAGIVLLLAAAGHSFFFNWVFILWLLQKGFFSFFS